jgi:hypothetical protein
MGLPCRFFTGLRRLSLDFAMEFVVTVGTTRVVGASRYRVYAGTNQDDLSVGVKDGGKDPSHQPEHKARHYGVQVDFDLHRYHLTLFAQ